MAKMNFKVDTYEKFTDLLFEIWNLDYGSVAIGDDKDFPDVKEGIIAIHTGGWSENEEALPKLQRTFYWFNNWLRSDRGGHYYLTIGQREHREQKDTKVHICRT